jgi:moderate conductance mechanosensitive channel
VFPPPTAQTPARLEEACGERPTWLCRQVFDATDDGTIARLADFLVGKPLTILFILLVAAIVNKLARRGIKRGLRRLHSGPVQERIGAVRSRTPSALMDTSEMSLRAGQRVEALATVLRSVASFAIWVVAAFMVLGTIGIQIGPLLAGAGILGVALGFGSQSLVRDFLSGIFILVEDQFGVGDIVDLGEAQGVVEVVSLRTTRIRSVDGIVWHVPNGEITRVGNMSQHWSRALLDIQVAYDTDIPTARGVMKGVADELWREDPAVLEEPEIWGVEDLGASGIAIRLVVKTKPSEQWAVSRELRERIKAAFDEAEIEIPFPQTGVWVRDAGQAEADGGGRAAAERSGGR